MTHSRPYAAALNRRSRRGKLAYQCLLYLVVGLGACMVSLPFLWMLSASLKKPADIFVFPPKWIPWPPNFDNYTKALSLMPFGLYTRNTLTVTFGAMIGDVLVCSLVAYGFARLRFPGRRQLFMLVLATMMMPYYVTMIPRFILFKQLQWVDTFLPLIVPALCATSGFYIFLFRQFYMGISFGIDDAARIDGCSTLGIWFRVLLPMSRPAIASVAIYSFLSHWNDFTGPLIYLNDMNKFTLSVSL
ncbi:MAG TPA: carbohydrate ABC transporter permease, partial [Clostridia bacterium]|nr:carbohydrate ABC transporter permease [Clostridia bacterium]